MPIREELFRARREANLSQSGLADLCTKLGSNFRQKDISNFEKGRQNPSLEKLEVIAKALGKNWKLD